MKRFIVILLTLAFIVGCQAQRTRTSVTMCGIKMGTPRNQVKSILVGRFGEDYVDDIANRIEVYNGSSGGITYKYMTFDFVWANGALRLNGGVFQSWFDLTEWEDAFLYRDYIKSIYEKKYKLKELDVDGYTWYLFGGQNPPNGAIVVELRRNNEGEQKYYVGVAYFGPYAGLKDDI